MLNNADQEGIIRARETIVSAILAGDARAYALSFTEDGVVMHPDSPYVRGRPALEEYAAGLFQMMAVTRLDMYPILVEGDGNYAYEVGTQSVVVEPSDEHFKPDRQYLHAYRKDEDGVWRIAAGMSGNM